MHDYGMLQEEECNIVTLGIGHDVTSERKMKLHFPEWCRFIGADPFSEINKYLYENIGGAYHKIAVGATNSIREARVYGGSFKPLYFASSIHYY